MNVSNFDAPEEEKFPKCPSPTVEEILDGRRKATAIGELLDEIRRATLPGLSIEEYKLYLERHELEAFRCSRCRRAWLGHRDAVRKYSTAPGESVCWHCRGDEARREVEAS
jgi:hypothetical protein